MQSCKGLSLQLADVIPNQREDLQAWHDGQCHIPNLLQLVPSQ